MTNFEKIKNATLEELADLLVDLGVESFTSEEEDNICLFCEYYDDDCGCMNYDKWTNGVCDPGGVRGRSTIKSWLIEEAN